MPFTSTIEQFSDDFRGTLIQPGDLEYSKARKVWNGMIDRRPAVIARCKDVADIMSSIEFAHMHNLPVSIKGGGHNVAGKAVCEDGMMIDLSLMKAIRVDPKTKTAKVQPGATWGDLDRATQAFGLATTGGVDSRTGVAGLTLGGGIGWLARSYGLAIDNLLSVDVVTATGELVHAADGENEDLFWGIRGDGGNLGVISSFDFQLHEVGPEVLTAQIFHPFDDAADVLRHYADFMSKAPDEISCYALIVHIPPVEPFPEEFHGQTALALIGCYSGGIEQGKEHFAPLQGFGNPILEAIMSMPYATLQQSFDAAYPDGERYYWKSCYLDELSTDAIDVLTDYGRSFPGAYSGVFIEPMGGAINRFDTGITAFPHRDAAYNLCIAAGWSDAANDDMIISKTREFHTALAPFANGGVYSNYLDHDEGDRVSAAFGGNYERLQDLKMKYDGNNFFNPNHYQAKRPAL